MRKISDEDYEEIRQMYYDGKSKKGICREKNISLCTLNSILSGDKTIYHYVRQYRKVPAGGIYPGMIAEAKHAISVGDYVDVTLKEEGLYSSVSRKYYKVIEKSENVFVVQIGKNTAAYHYKDLLVRDSGVRFDRRKRK